MKAEFPHIKLLPFPQSCVYMFLEYTLSFLEFFVLKIIISLFCYIIILNIYLRARLKKNINERIIWTEHNLINHNIYFKKHFKEINENYHINVLCYPPKCICAFTEIAMSLLSVRRKQNPKNTQYILNYNPEIRHLCKNL